MDTFGDTRPRRLFDARFDYNQRRGTTANEAERAIILRLVDGVAQQYLVLMGTGWRAELTDYDRSEPKVQLWYEAVERMLKNEDLMSQLKLKADFYRELWNSMPVLVQRLSRSRDDWITLQLARHSQEDIEPAHLGASDGFPVPKKLVSRYTEFERRYFREDKYKKAAQQTYFELTQPEAAEFLRKQAAEKLAKETEERAKIAEAAAKDKSEAETTFQEKEETRYQQMKGDSALILAKGKSPIVWDWEKDSTGKTADSNAMDVDKSTDVRKLAHEATTQSILSSARKDVLAYAAEKRKWEAC
ncbi:hypothetical protein CONLIGDRAFT_714857 [Coniochaeta ligniaria NRRL 30616]|uniref:Uncharacterized protein n=1 Tax=Coniochaeta ligniaria NRRL 30616 TaxID=1408157 RepID=A0A1J7JF40_9PEZI|nr:hypothetical protein CONLIGDRAFT_714857 [Coniochaeta ligniaria NRRL 30616]